MNRRQSREAAFCLLFEWAFHAEPFEALVENAKAARELEADDFALALTQKTIEQVEPLDALIEKYSEGWKVSRLSKATLSILRLAFCEITVLEDIPIGATINEAVELCKKYASEDEAAFVNGILGKHGRSGGSTTDAPEKETEDTVDDGQ
ncbi:MAG: transcription antitermination factor NusB [Oscillospiraceae bacterium]|nr:transcription antitermination factor NusB [Oscillospiraceae bacterium]